MKYGIDEYSRYVEKEGERLVVERYPFFNPYHKLTARIDIVRWHIGIIKQHGWSEWNSLRKM